MDLIDFPQILNRTTSARQTSNLMYNMVREEEMSSKKVAARWSKRATLLRNRSLFEQTLNENQMRDTQSLDQSCSISQKATKKLPMQNSILDESDQMHMSGVENDQGKNKILNLIQQSLTSTFYLNPEMFLHI